MIGLVLAAAAVGAVAGQLPPGAVGGELEVVPSATVEARAGEAPLVYLGAPTPMIIEVVTPGVGLSYFGRRLELLAGYQLRMFWQQARGADPTASPLLLHLVNLALTARPTERSELKLIGTANEGQADYTYVSSSVFQNNQAQVVVPPKILAANLTGEADLHLTRLATAGIAFQAVRSQPLGQPAATATTTTTATTPPTPTLVLPYFTSFAATPGVTVRLSRTDDTSSAVAVQYQRVSDLSLTDSSGTSHPGSAISAFIVSPTVAFHRTLSPHSEFTIKVGASVAHLDSDVAGASNSVAATGGAALSVRLLSTRQAILQAKASQSLDYFLDPVLGTAAEHATTTGDLTLGLPKNWTIALEGSFVTPFEAHPIPAAPPAPPTYFDEVAAAAQLSARHLLSNDLLLEFGGRWADRRPFFDAPPPYNTGFHQRQLFVFVTLSGTTHPTWLPKREVANVQ